MTGYGGFDVSLTPTWNPAYAWWLQQGGCFAVPNMRGGGEYGESWHEQGMFEKKQNVFDDWFAAARYLIDQKYTSPQHFAITGRSNGGLLMGASFTQHPETVLRGVVRLPPARHASLSEIRARPPLDHRVWLRRKREAVSLPLQEYSPYQNVKPRDPRSPPSCFPRRQRHTRRSATRSQDDRSAPVDLHHRPSHSPPLPPTGGHPQALGRAADSGPHR